MTLSQPRGELLPPSASELITSDGEPMDSARHRQQMILLIESLEYAWRGRSDFYVGGDMFVYFSETQALKNDFRGPDVFVVLNTDRRERKAWVVWKEDGKTPNVVIELLSDSTAAFDRGVKKEIYAGALRVGEYFLFDPFTGLLEGYELEAGLPNYLTKEPDSDGRLLCKQMGLRLGVQPGCLWSVDAPWLRWFGRSGAALPLPSEAAEWHAEHAEAEAQRAEAEARRAEAEARRAEAEAQRAEVEAARADAAEQRVRELLAELARR